MAALSSTTPRIGARVRARLLGEAILAITALVVVTGATVTLAEPVPSLGSVPVVAEAGR